MKKSILITLLLSFVMFGFVSTSLQSAIQENSLPKNEVEVLRVRLEVTGVWQLGCLSDYGLYAHTSGGNGAYSYNYSWNGAFSNPFCPSMAAVTINCCGTKTVSVTVTDGRQTVTRSITISNTSCRCIQKESSLK